MSWSVQWLIRQLSSDNVKASGRLDAYADSIQRSCNQCSICNFPHVRCVGDCPRWTCWGDIAPVGMAVLENHTNCYVDSFRLPIPMAGDAWGSLDRPVCAVIQYGNPHRPPPCASAQAAFLQRKVYRWISNLLLRRVLEWLSPNHATRAICHCPRWSACCRRSECNCAWKPGSAEPRSASAAEGRSVTTNGGQPPDQHPLPLTLSVRGDWRPDSGTAMRRVRHGRVPCRHRGRSARTLAGGG